MPASENKEVWQRFLNAYFGFSFIWAFGAHYKQSAHRYVDNMFRDLFGKLHIPLADSVFDYRMVEEKHLVRFVHWKESLAKFEYPGSDTPFFQLLVPTVDQTRHAWLL